MTEEGELIAGRYRLISRVGTGAMGVVWQAHDERLQRIVAVKQLLLPSGTGESEAAEASRRAMREGRIAARLHHPHAITVYDVAEHEGKPCLIMEYLRAKNLSTVLATQGTLPADNVARIGSQIASALAAAHAVGIVHRDIKPGNVLLTEDGTAKITDFGISRAVGDHSLTTTGIVAGTPAYLAPEIAQGQDAGFAADVFSLGSTLYTAVEGAPPFGLDDNFLALLYRIGSSEITSPTRSGPLAPVLLRILQRDPSRRPTMQQAQKALAAVAGLPPVPTRAPRTAAVALPKATPLPVSEPSSTTVPRRQRWADSARRRRWVVAALVALALAVGGVLVAIASADGSRVAGSGTSLPGTTTQNSATQNSAPDEQTPRLPPPQLPPPQVSTTETTPTHTLAPSPTTIAAPGPATTAAGPQDTPEQLETAISSYYALMPTDLQEGWNRLTADYQTNHAGGFSGYQNFWSAIRQVETSDTSATSPHTVTATIVYFFKDGRIVTEQTSFGLVAEDGQWKIASSTVLTSRTTSS